MTIRQLQLKMRCRPVPSKATGCNLLQAAEGSILASSQQLRKLCLLKAIVGRRIAFSTTTCHPLPRRSDLLPRRTPQRTQSSTQPNFCLPECVLHTSQYSKLLPLQSVKFQHTGSVRQEDEDSAEHGRYFLEEKDRSVPGTENDIDHKLRHSRGNIRPIDEGHPPENSENEIERQLESEKQGWTIWPHRHDNPASLREAIYQFLADHDVDGVTFVSSHPEIVRLVEQSASALSLSCMLNEQKHSVIRKSGRVLNLKKSRKKIAIIWHDGVVAPLLPSRAELKGAGLPSQQFVADQHWSTIEYACQGIVAGMPSLAFLKQPSPDGTTKQVWQVQLTNDVFQIKVVRNFTGQQSWQTVFPELAHEYSQQLSAKVKQPPQGLLRFNNREGGWGPHDFLMRAYKKLDYGGITFVSGIARGLSPFEQCSIWQCQLHTQRHGQMGRSQAWFAPKKARHLAVFAAVQTAYDELKKATARGEVLLEDFLPFAAYGIGDESYYAELASTQPDAEKSLEPFTLQVPAETMSAMVSVLQKIRSYGLPNECSWAPMMLPPTQQSQKSKNQSFEKDISPGEAHREEHRRKFARQSYRNIMARRRSLPIMKPTVEADIVQKIQDNDVVIISSATGSGKTTQVPQIILDHFIELGKGPDCNVLCTQPRRIAATAIARQVAHERETSLGQSVGYKVRFDNREPCQAGSICYATTGLSLRWLQEDYAKFLSRFSHIILDEVHVRDLDTDILVTRLRDILAGRASSGTYMPKLILMSATIDTSLFERYFSEAESQVSLRATSIHVSGSPFSVSSHTLDSILPELQNRFSTELTELGLRYETQMYLRTQQVLSPGFFDASQNDDALSVSYEEPITDITEEDLIIIPIDLLALMVKYLTKTTQKGDVLVFLPGLAEIDRLADVLTDVQHLFSDTSHFKLFKLHSAMYDTNDEVFQPVSPGCRRIILSTNIAETSVTLPDVVHVVDSGRARVNIQDPLNQRNDFILKWISKAEVTQRRGRAGRVSHGHYYAMFSTSQYDQFEETSLPVILSIDLTGMILGQEILGQRLLQEGNRELWQGQHPPDRFKAMTNATTGFLEKTLTPPRPDMVRAFVKELERINAVVSTKDGYPATALGYALGRMPVLPAVGKAVLLGVLFQCLSPLVTIAAEKHDTPLFGYRAPSRRALAVVRSDYSGWSRDDRMATVNGFRAYKEAVEEQNEDGKRALTTQQYIREPAFWEMVRASSQIYRLLTNAGILSESTSPTQRDTWRVPTAFDVHADNVGLIKALSLAITGSRLAVWKFRHFRLKHVPRVLVEPRSVNTVKRRGSSLFGIDHRNQGDLLAYDAMKTVQQEIFPWLYQSSRISPLTAMLFGNSIQLADDGTIIVDEWLTYKIECADKRFGSSSKIIFEFRKALDRWLTVAFADIDLGPISTRGDVGKRNTILSDVNNPLRRLFVDCLAQILRLEEDIMVAKVKPAEVGSESEESAFSTRDKKWQ